MIALSPELVYVREPFNIEYPHQLSPLPVDRWYKHIPSGTKMREYHDVLKRVLNLRYPLNHHLRTAETIGEMYFHLRHAVWYAWHRWKGCSVLLKDPLALLAAEWLDAEFDLDVLVMIRHPAAFAGSLKEKGWTHPFEDFLAQPQLMEGYFADYTDEIETFANRDRDIVDQAALLWTLLYTVVAAYRKKHPEWTFLRHEDVARAPVDTFQKLYDQYDLDFTDEIRKRIEEHSHSPGESASENSIHRDSQSVVRNWTRRLTSAEIARVRERTESIASKYYQDDEW
jgi:hypothetical protein